MDPYLVHVHSHEHERFHNHTTESVNAVVANLQDIAAHGTNPQLRMLQQSTGIKYDPDGIMFDVEARLRRVEGLKPRGHR